MALAPSAVAYPTVAPGAAMNRDGFLARYRDSIWEGGARYWRGKVMYQPAWAVRDLLYERATGYWHHGPAPMIWLVEIERLDDNSASQPRGTRRRIALQCFQPWENFPGGALLRPLTGVRARPSIRSTIR
jgi:hypothetical protein